MASWHLGNMYSSGLHWLDRDDEGKTVHCFHKSDSRAHFRKGTRNQIEGCKSGLSSSPSEVFLSADRDIGYEHDAGMSLEKRAEASEDRFDFFLRYYRQDDFEALLFTGHEMGLPHPMVSFPRNVADNRVAGRFHSIQQIGDKRPVFSRDDHADFLHRMQGQTHVSFSFPGQFRYIPKNTSLRCHDRVPRPVGAIAIPNPVFRVERDQMDPLIVIIVLKHFVTCN